MDREAVYEGRNRQLNSIESSRLPGFYEIPAADRRDIVRRFANLEISEAEAMGNYGCLSPELCEVFIENAVGSFELPLGIATNFSINGQDLLIPMAVEETSVVAAASHGAKLARTGGGFRTSSTAPIGTGQVQLFPKAGFDWNSYLLEQRQSLIDLANDGHERLRSRGGGARDLSWRYFSEINALVIYLDVDTRDAMGANMINSMCERLGKHLQQQIPSELGLRILTNLTDKRLARAHCLVKQDALKNSEFSGTEVVERIERAYEFAAHDIYRAATHNKGVMNGIDPVVIATGNDWRAVEAGAHAYCCRNGRYEPMTKWWKNQDGDLEGSIELALAVGTVGGVTKLHPTAKAALKLLGSPSSQGLAEILCAVGLAQNLSALRALASEGIQKGHMSLHQGNLAMARSGATKN